MANDGEPFYKLISEIMEKISDKCENTIGSLK